MKQRILNLNEQQQIAVAAATGLLQALQLTIQQNRSVLSRQHLQDFRLAVRILFKYTDASRHISDYGEIYKALLECNVTQSTPPMDGLNSEISNLAIASQALRTIAKQYSSTKKNFLASSDQETREMQEVLGMLD